MMDADNWRRVPSYESQSVLILNQNSVPCAAEKCESLLDSLRRSLAVRCIQGRCNNRLPDGLSLAPDLILIRSSVCEAAQELIASCKAKWARSSILALLCARWDRMLEESASVLTKVDDFLPCPFQEAELVLRVK